MRRYDDLVIDAPFWSDALLEIDQTPFPKAAVSALAGFGLGDEIQMIEGFGEADAATCGVIGVVTALVASLGPAACNVIGKASDKETCQSIIATGGAGAGAALMAGLGCGRTPTVRPVPPVTPAPRPAPRPPPPAPPATRSTDNMILIGGGLALAAALAYIAFGR